MRILTLVLLALPTFAQAMDCSQKGTVTVKGTDPQDIREAAIGFCDPRSKPDERTFCRIKDIRYEGPTEDPRFSRYAIDCREP